MQRNISSSQQKRKRTVIRMEHADSTVFNKDGNPNVHIMKGNVIFRHDNTHLYCDSAYFYERNNSLEAFDNVRIVQGDTLFIYGNYLVYEGNLNLAKMRGNVRMENRSVRLFTDNLDYDRNVNLGYFFDGGILIDALNRLTAVYGQYSPNTKIADFSNEIILTNPQFVLTSDTLKYNTVSKVATILGYSVIESDSVIIRSTKGWYNTETDKSALYNRSVVESKDGAKILTADTLFYNRRTDFGEAFSRMALNDTVQKVILMGNYGYYDNLKGFAFATDSAQLIGYSQKTDSLFLHADTLQMRIIDKDREIKAFYGVRIYGINLQGVCDSLQFNTKDSTLYLCKNPILWHADYQMSGDMIKILFNDTTIEQIGILDRAFVMEEKDSTYFNQIKGKNLTAFFIKGELSQVDIEGNTETIYYPIENNGTGFIGRNKTTSTYMTIYIRNRKPTKIWWYPEPKAEMLPILDLNREQKFLKDFVNYNYLRPKNKDDIFTPKTINVGDVPAFKKRHR